jgi:hypothetical protein
MRKLFLFGFLFLSQISYGQFAIIQSNHGKINVRRTPEFGNNVFDSLSDGQIIYYDMDPRGDWYEINYSIYITGYIHKSVFEPIRNFKRMPIRTQSADSIVFQNDSIKVTLTKTPFISNNNQLQYTKEDKKNHILSMLEKINGKRPWGTVGDIPRNQYGGITIEWGKNIFGLPKSSFDDLYEPNFEYNYTSVFLDKSKNRLYIYGSNSDGGGGYDVLWIIENGKYITRYLSNFYA